MPAAPQWKSMAGTYDDLVVAAGRWPTTAATPAPVAAMLAMTRDSFAHMYFVYELGPMTITWSLITVEAALRHRLDALDAADKRGLAALANEAHQLGYLSDRAMSALEGGRQLRNRFAHGRIHGVFAPGGVAQALEATHGIVAEVFPDPTEVPS
jgi:hypothetical protein